MIASDNTIIWLARYEFGDYSYIAVFNISDARQTIHYEWKDLGLAANSYSMRDLWLRKNLHSATSLDVTLEPHASVLFQGGVDGIGQEDREALEEFQSTSKKNFCTRPQAPAATPPRSGNPNCLGTLAANTVIS